MALAEHDEGLDDRPAPLVGRSHGRRLAHGRMLDARRLDLEGADPVPGRDDHVVRAPRVPVVAVLVALRRVLRVEPLAAEGLCGRLLVAPVSERVVRVGAGPEADLAALTNADRVFVL